MTPAPKPRRISREEAIVVLNRLLSCMGEPNANAAAPLRMALRALKREQKAADAKRKDKRRTK